MFTVEKQGGVGVRIPDEYTCSLCGYAFLDGEVPGKELFCPNCGSSTVIKELTYDEFLDDDESFMYMVDYGEYKNSGI
jgi:DNA-directed RNA polymerase subunit RPC12/RpoP